MRTVLMLKRTLSTPDADDMRNLAEGGTVDLDVDESELLKEWMWMMFAHLAWRKWRSCSL